MQAAAEFWTYILEQMLSISSTTGGLKPISQSSCQPVIYCATTLRFQLEFILSDGQRGRNET
jgi:hypothetical protein